MLLLGGLFGVKSLLRVNHSSLINEEVAFVNPTKVKTKKGFPGEAIPEKPILYVNPGTLGNDSTGTGSEAKPFKTPSKAITNLAEGGTIYIQGDLTITGTISIANTNSWFRVIKIMSDPDLSTTQVMTRAFASNSIFNISGNSELIFENIILDGKKSSYSGTNMGAAIALTGTVTTNPTLTLLKGSELRNNATTNGAASIQSDEGTINMYAGRIYNGLSSVGLTAIASKNAKEFNLLGGEITGNTKTDYAGTGCVYINGDSYNSINLGGNMKIYGNTVKTNLANLLLGSAYMVNIIEDFTGEVYINTSSRNTVGAIFGTIAEDVEIFQGTFRNDANTALFGGREGSTLLWKNYENFKLERVDGLDVLLANYNEADYLSEKWAEIVNYFNQAREAILAANNYDALKLIDLNQLKENCDSVLTIKGVAKASLDEYLLTLPNPSAEIKAIIDLAKLDIDAQSIDDIEGIIAKAKEDIADQIAIELQEKKDFEIDAINNAVLALDSDDYSEDNWNAILDAQTEAIQNINAVTLISEVTPAKEAGLQAIDDVLTLEEELQIAKVDAKDELTNYLAGLTDPTTEVIKIINDAKDDIDLVDDINDLEGLIDKAKGDVVGQIAIELQEKKDFEIDAINNAVLALDSDDYSEDNWNAILDVQTEAIQNINAVTLISEVTPAKEAGLQAIDDVLTLEEELQLAKIDAIEAINDFVDSLKEKDYSEANWDEIIDAQGKAIDEINAATSVSEVKTIEQTELNKIDDVLTLLEVGYDDVVIDALPSADTGGSATVTHPDLPDVTIDIELPALDDEDYDVKIVGGEAIYTYVDPNTGVSVELSFDLPEDGYSEPVVTVPPSGTDGGTAIVNHPDLPGADIVIELPPLGEDTYDIVITPDSGATSGEVTYTYVDDVTQFEITITVPYDYETIDWNVKDNPTLEEGGTIIGTSDDLPGVSFELTLPKLSADDYDITTNSDGTLTYTLKDPTHGVFSFIVTPSDRLINLWPIIIIEIIVILGLIAGNILIKRRNDKRDEKTDQARASMTTLPALFLLRYIPNGAIVIIIVLAIVILGLAGYLVYLLLHKSKIAKEEEQPASDDEAVVEAEHDEEQKEEN